MTTVAVRPRAGVASRRGDRRRNRRKHRVESTLCGDRDGDAYEPHELETLRELQAGTRQAHANQA